MTTKALTPAPNRRANGTVDPNYKKPSAPPAPPGRAASSPTMAIYFLRKKGTEQYYQRRGGRMNHCGDMRGTRDPKWGPLKSAACWTSPNGPRPIKGSDGEIVMFKLGEEITR